LPETTEVELVNIVGYLAEQIETHMEENHPDIISHYVMQENPRGQSHAIHLARQHLKGPMLVIFADTLIETDLSFLKNESADAVAWVKAVEDPRRFGVAVVGEDGRVKKIIEKPEDVSNNLAVVGFYFFKSAEDLLAAIEEQMARDLQLKGEYYLADAINILLERGLNMRTEKVGAWLDAGTPEALLDTNRYLLENGSANDETAPSREGVVIVPPVFVHPSAQVSNSIIGPYVSIGAGCRVESSILRDSILEEEAKVRDVILERSLIGRRAEIQRRAGMVSAGDQTVVTL
jgi:glucose-1-phosphate thymidylyltransferase